MNRALRFYSTSIGKKVAMGLTGLIWVGFVIGHMTGNLLVLRGREEINAYSEFLKSTGELLWLARAVLAGALLLHVAAAVQLTLHNRAARPVGYVRRESQIATVASRTMRWGGALLLVFIVLHILHFTTGTIRPAGMFIATDVYANVVSSFKVWWVAAFYVVSMVALAFHLYHGVWSSVRSLGLAQPSADPLHRRFALIVAVIVWLGFTIVPVAVMAGWVG
ncbi:MAG: succinate dehydrogenase cytochrome b subunit [Gemmatimonadaceae bacterium]